jgi:hypothetical protein
MKLTWFGGTALRVYVGGQILVIDPDAAPVAVDRGEMLAGADRVVSPGDPLPVVDPATWRAARVPRLMEELPPAQVARLEQTLLISAAGEPALVIVGAGGLPRFGRWAKGAVIVLTSANKHLVADVSALLDVAEPRLLAMAVDEQTLDRVVDEVAEHLNGTGLSSLEPGLALEV